MNLTRFCAAILAMALAGPAWSADQDPIKKVTLSELDWQKTSEGVAFAALIGNRFEDSYMAMVRLPAGLVSPVHTKSATMYGIVLSGQIVHVAQGQERASDKILATGSFYEVPAGLPHLSKCVSSEDCVTFLYQDGAFDFLPVLEQNQ